MPEHIRYQILTAFVKITIGRWPSVFSPDAALAISGAHIDVGVEIETCAGIPSEGGECLHLVMLFGIGHEVDIQIANIVDEMTNALAGCSLAEDLQSLT